MFLFLNPFIDFEQRNPLKHSLEQHHHLIPHVEQSSHGLPEEYVSTRTKLILEEKNGNFISKEITNDRDGERASYAFKRDGEENSIFFNKGEEPKNDEFRKLRDDLII